VVTACSLEGRECIGVTVMTVGVAILEVGGGCESTDVVVKGSRSRVSIPPTWGKIEMYLPMCARSSRKGTVNRKFRFAADIAELSAYLSVRRPVIATESWDDPIFPFVRGGIPDAIE